MRVVYKMENEKVLKYVFKNSDQAKTMALKTKGPLPETMECVDPGLLFQRLLDVAERTPGDLEETFSYEMSNMPTSLFDTSGLPRLSNKSIFAQHLWNSTAQKSARPPDDVCFVIDGGSSSQATMASEQYI